MCVICFQEVSLRAPSATKGFAMTCTRFSRLYTIRLDENRAEKCPLLLNNTRIKKFDTKQLPYPHIES